jgi:hypothetical protein
MLMEPVGGGGVVVEAVDNKASAGAGAGRKGEVLLVET